MEWTSWHEKHADKIELVAGVDCWIWIGAQGGGGYGRVSYMGGAEFAHRAAYIEGGGDFSSGNVVRHLCGVRFCVRTSHLIAGTSKQNAEDTSLMFRCRGSSSPEVVLGIRQDYASGMTLSDLSAKYEMAEGSIVQVASGRAYANFRPDTVVKPNRFPRKLDAEKVAEIHALIAKGVPQSKIARQFNVAKSSISRVNTGARWGGVRGRDIDFTPRIQDRLAHLLDGDE